MWYGKNYINEYVYNSNIKYASIINTRIDFFSTGMISRRMNDYGNNLSNLFLYNNLINNMNNKKINFLKDNGAGIDNYYTGPIEYLYKLSNLFNYNFDDTIKFCSKKFKQEEFVHEVAVNLFRL